MKISVNGHIIETKNILDITPIRGNKCWGNNEKCLTHSAYEFEIIFFNHKNMNIYLSGNQFFGYDGWWESANVFQKNGDNQYCRSEEGMSIYKENLKKIYDKINSHRDEIIKIWSDNQSTIPQINLYNK